MPADAAFWNNLAERYAAKPIDFPDAFEKKVAITQSLMRPDDVVLNIGCGTGSLALRLAGHARQIHGVDISDEMVRIAREKVAAAGVDNIHFHIGAVEGELPVEPGTLDGLCAYSILHLLEDRTAMLARIFDLLTPGGFFVSSTVVLGDSWVPYRPMLAVMKWLGKAPDVWVIPRQQLVEEVRAAGFVDVELPDVGAKDNILFMVARKPA